MKKNNSPIIDLLNEVLTAELTAINQYFLHAELCEHWGYTKLYQFTRKQSIDEMKHAEQLIERILFLDGLPNIQRLGKISVGETVPEQFKADLKLETEAVDRLKPGIELCRAQHDPISAVLLESILASEEAHVDFLGKQLDLIAAVGEANYLAQQIIVG
ncbi:MAG: bacterioferritin [Myxococcota bacterium]